MTVTTTTASQTFQGNGVATAFPCAFEIFLDTDVNVYFVDPTTGVQTPAVLNSDYTVSGAGASGGFTVNTTVPVPTGTNLYVVRALPLTQPTDFTNQGAFFPTLHEAAFDRLCMLIQQVANYSEGLNITMPPGLAPQPSTTFPAPQNSSLIGWDPTGTFLMNVGSSGYGAEAVTDRNVAPDAGVQSSKLAFKPAGESAISRTVQAKLQDVIGVKDFGAKGDGTTDDTTAFQDAADLGASVSVPAGSYVIGSVNAGASYSYWRGDFALPVTGTPLPLPGTQELWFGTSRMFYQGVGGITDSGVLRVQRATSYSGAGSGEWENSTLHVLLQANAAAGSYETGLLVELVNDATSVSAENTAAHVRATKASSSPTWCATQEAVDTTGAANPATGLVGIEQSVQANGTDASSNRVGIDIIASRPVSGGVYTGDTCVVGYGLRLTNQVADSAQNAFNVGVGLHGYYDTAAIDISAATLNPGAVGIRLATGQAVAFDTAATCQLSYSNVSNTWSYAVSGTNVWSISDGGVTDQTGILKILGTQILSSRATGWSMPTGTLSRATFDPSTVTLQTLAQVVAALLTDLIGHHGLIGD